MAERRVLDGRYELDELPIGKGGMGEVWLGRDVRLGREVAVKLIRFPDDAHDADLVRRFVRESRITARLEHPGVPAVFDVGTHQGRPFMVMERIRGITVSDLVAEQGQLPIGWAVAIATQACAVLAAAHAAALVHRDLKPGNLMLCPDGSVRVLDFGLAVALGAGDSLITRAGQALGTPAYMAPELVMAGTTEPRTDLYALGATLHEMLSGRAPFRGATAYAVMSKHVDERPPALRTLRADVPRAVEAIVLELLAKRPEDRPASAVDVFDRLVPFAVDLGMLPGVLAAAQTPSPTRMYAGVLQRVLGDERPSPAAESTPDAPVGRAELARARAEASSLVRGSQYSRAAEILAAVATPATRAFGPRDPDVVSLRFELANVRFDGGDYRGAGPVYRALAADLSGAPEMAFRCRQQEATCAAMTGDVEGALARLAELVADERAAWGPDDDRVLDLRRQTALLEAAAGHPGRARERLRAVLDDVERARGADDAMTVAVRTALADLPAVDDG